MTTSGMDDMARVENSWRLESPIAELSVGGISGRVDVSRPQLGLHRVAFNGQPQDARLLSLGSDDAGRDSDVPGWPVADAYVRGHDLVAMYRPRDDWPFSPQVYWQANAPQSASDALGGLSLFISVQTHLLDTWPRISVRSQATADETLHVMPDDARHRATPLSRPAQTIRPTAGATCVLRRLAGQRLSYAEIMPASDFREVRVEWDAGGSCHTRWELFADFLEKGVIWRSRLQAVLLPRENDILHAIACCRAFQERPLPLTT